MLVDSVATYATELGVILPDNPGAEVNFRLATNLALTATPNEIFPYRQMYSLFLDDDGVGTIFLPTPDNTGATTWDWTVLLPEGNSYTFSLPYSAALQQLADRLAEVALAEPAATSFLFPTTCFCAMTVGVEIPPNLEVLMPVQVSGQTAALHPGGIAGTLTMPVQGLWDFQATVYTEPITAAAGAYLDVKFRKNQESDNLIVAQNRPNCLVAAAVAQFVPVLALAVSMEAGDTMELYLSHTHTAPIAFYVQRLVAVRRGDYA